MTQPTILPETALSGAFQADSQPLAAAALPTHDASATATASPTATGSPTSLVNVCYSDEQISFVPENSQAGSELLIAVTSAGPHPYPKRAGTENPTFVRERLVQLGHLWEWTVQLTYPGSHDYTFYVDPTILRESVSLKVGAPLATRTPQPYYDDDYDNADNLDNFDVYGDDFDKADNSDNGT